jgi:hypothetical protein
MPIKLTPRVLAGLRLMRLRAVAEIDADRPATRPTFDSLAAAIKWLDSILDRAYEPPPPAKRTTGALTLSEDERNMIREAHEARARQERAAETKDADGVSPPPAPGPRSSRKPRTY